MDEHTPRISIITNVYDAKDFLPLTVQSILASTFTDFELLLVEDGSPNGCGELCDRLAETDSRIRVFHKPNGGPASASNVGLDNARGEYVGFVDSDDLIEPTMYETLYRMLRESGAPLAACGADCIDESGKEIPGFNLVECSRAGTFDALELFRHAFTTGSFYGPLSWNKLMALRLFRDKGVHYDERLLYGDDASVLHRVFADETICCTNEHLYHYRTRAGSITTRSFHPRKLDDLTMYWDWLQFFKQRTDPPGLYPLALARYWQVFYIFYCQATEAGMADKLQKEFAYHLTHLRAILPEIQSCDAISSFEKLRARLFCINPAVTYRLAKVWGRLHPAPAKEETTCP